MTTQEANRRLVKDLKRVIRDAEDLVSATSGEVGEKVTGIRHRLSTALERAKGSVDNIQEHIQEQTLQAARATDETIRRHPYESLGVALGAGLLIGVLVRGRCNGGE